MAHHSEQINELAAALAKAQSEFRGAEEDKINPHFKSKYSSLNALWSACREGLSKNGLSVSQIPQRNGAGIDLVTLLLHSSGQWIRSELPVIDKIGSPQALGSAITYAKRYALSGIVGISSGDDDDGNAAQEQAKRAAQEHAKKTVIRQKEPPTGYDDFYRKIGMHKREDSAMCDFIAEVCLRFKWDESQAIQQAMANQEEFFSSFENWKKKQNNLICGTRE